MPSELRLEGPAATTARYDAPCGRPVTRSCAGWRVPRANAPSIWPFVTGSSSTNRQSSPSPTWTPETVEDSTIAVLGYSDGIAVGTVRLFLLEPAAGPLAGRPARRAVGVPHARDRGSVGPIRGGDRGRARWADDDGAHPARERRLLRTTRVGQGRRAGDLRGAPSPTHVHRPADPERGAGDGSKARGRDQRARPVTPVTARSITTARCPPDRNANSPDSSTTPTTAASSPRSWNAARQSFSRPGRSAQQECVRREAGQPLLHRHTDGAGESIEVQRDPEPAPLEQHRQRTDEPRHADILGGDTGTRGGYGGEDADIACHLIGALCEGTEEREVGSHRPRGASGHDQ